MVATTSTTIHRLTLPILLAASTMTVMAGATIAPSLPELARAFAATPNADLLAKLVLTIPGLTIALTAPLAGWIGDKAGKVRLMLAGIVLYVLAGGSGLVLSSLEALLVGRLLLGVAVGMVMTSASALIADLFTGIDRERVTGLQAGAMGLGGVVFLLAGGALAEFSWRGPFAVYLVPILLLPLAMRVLVEPPRRTEPVAGGGFPWRIAGTIYVTVFIGMIVFYMIPAQLPFLLDRLGNPSPMLAGVGVATGSATSAIGSMFVQRRLRQRFSPERTTLASFATIALGYTLIGTAPTVALAFPGLIIAGLGLGLQMPTLVGALQMAVPPHMRARAAGGFTTAVFFGQFVSPLVHGPVAGSLGYGGAFVAVAAASAVVAAAFLVVPLGQKPSETKTGG